MQVKYNLKCDECILGLQCFSERCSHINMEGLKLIEWKGAKLFGWLNLVFHGCIKYE